MMREEGDEEEAEDVGKRSGAADRIFGTDQQLAMRASGDAVRLLLHCWRKSHNRSYDGTAEWSSG